MTVVDLFCGGGGSGRGLVEAGWRLLAAANHSRVAIATHEANFPDAEHLCVDISAYDMRNLPRARALWASPICTEISPAGGRRRAPAGQEALPMPWEEYGAVEPESWERTRATAYDVIRATEVWRYDVVMIENVVEFVTDWPLFDWWRQGMHLQGYTSQIVSYSSAHVGDDDNESAAQWRDRIYIVFTRIGVPEPDLRLRPVAWCRRCDGDVDARQVWRPGRSVGKYRKQYDYVCGVVGCGAVVEPYVRPAASIIDWDNPGKRIGDRNKTKSKPEGLAPATMRRIRAGLTAYPLDPSLITVNHAGHDGRPALPDDAPLAARTAKIGDGLLVPVGGQRNTTSTSTADPMRTRMANPKGYEALVSAPYIVELRNHGGAHPTSRPLSTISAGGNHHGLVIPYRRASARPTTHPMHTLGTVDSAGLLTDIGQVDVADCHFRMIQPREQLLAQRFPHDYVVTGTRGEQTAQAGNAVSVNVARWIGERVAAALNGSPA
ncbi:MAG: DNA cytosine methyltransferase [Stackebrandtia sp.]